MAIPDRLKPFVSPDFDFNGDGKTDILWRNYTTGENQVWLMDGTTVTATALLPSFSLDWLPIA